jgi:hypothetical protein
MQVDVEPTVVGRLITFLFQSPVLSLNIHSGDEVHTARFIPGTAKRGFFINPLLFENKDIANLYQGKGIRVMAVSFSRPDFPLEQLANRIQVKVYGIE